MQRRFNIAMETEQPALGDALSQMQLQFQRERASQMQSIIEQFQTVKLETSKIDQILTRLSSNPAPISECTSVLSPTAVEFSEDWYDAICAHGSTTTEDKSIDSSTHYREISTERKEELATLQNERQKASTDILQLL